MLKSYDESHEVGVVLFDNMQPSQQLAVLYQAANAPLRPDVPEPELTAVNEATVFALDRQLLCDIEIEIDTASMVLEHGRDADDPFKVRGKALAAFEQDISADELRDFREAGFIPDVTCADSAEWEPLVESLADRILWDRDFDMEDVLADIDPDRSELMKKHLGVDEGYYTAVAAELHDDTYATIREELRRLVRV